MTMDPAGELTLLPPIQVDNVSRRFDYDQLPYEIASLTRDRASRIRRHHRLTAESAMEIGRELMRAKSQLAHGQFEGWVEHELGFSVRSARNFMALAKAFLDNSATVAVLPPVTLYKLAAAPDQIREGIVSLVEAGDITDRNVVEKLIAERRSECAEAERLAKLTPQARKKGVACKKRRARRLQRQQEQQAARQAEEDRVADEAAREVISRLRPHFVIDDIVELDGLWNRSRGRIESQIQAAYTARAEAEDEAYTC